MYVKEIFNTFIHREGKGTEKEVRFLYIIWTDKIMIAVDCDKLCILARTTTKKAIQKDILENTIDKSKWILTEGRGKKQQIV